MSRRPNGPIFEDTFTEYRTLDARLRECMQRWPELPNAVLYAPLHAPGFLTIVADELRVTLVESPAWVRGGRAVDDAVERALSGRAALIVVGTPEDDLATLRARGVYDVVPGEASDLSLFFAVLRALDYLRARSDADALRGYRFGYGVVSGFVHALRAAESPLAACELCVNTCQQALHADAGSLYLAEGDGPDGAPRWLRLAVALNHSGSAPPTGAQFPVGVESVAGAVALMRTPVSLADAYALPRDAPYRFDRSVDERTMYRTHSLLTVPVEGSRGELLGVLQLLNRRRDGVERIEMERAEACVQPFDERERDVAASLGAQLGNYLETAALRRDLGLVLEGLVHASANAADPGDHVLARVAARLSAVGRRVLAAGGR